MNIAKEAIYFFKEIFRRKFQIAELTRRDFKQRYAGSFLGLLWVFLEPLAFILILWFVFSLGFKANPSQDVPFVAYLFVGLIVYNFFVDAVSASTSVIRSYAYLVTKVNFSLSILPIVKIISALILHVVFILLVLVVLIFNDIVPSLFWFQTLYYLFAYIAFILGLGWLLSAFGAFIRDMAQIVGIFLRFAFWVTPIFWNITMLPEKYRVYLNINPLVYIVQGYRESMIYNVPFWHHPYSTTYFWAVTFLLLLLGSLVFKKLMPHFADVL